MKVLITSVPFSPSIGGIESVTACLAEEFSHLGHSVHVVTLTPGLAPEIADYAVIRNPSPAVLLGEYRWADVILQNNVSLQFAWPRLVVRKPFLVVTQTWLFNLSQKPSMAARLKLAVIRKSRSLAISTCIAEHVGGASRVVGNPFDDRTFRRLAHIGRDRDLLFVGRLVSDKGPSMFVKAVAHLAQANPALTATIVGSGPEEAGLKQLVNSLGVEERIRFAGPLKGDSLSEEYNRHRVLTIPSLWEEPFGVVALEGIACGCVCVASQAGGLSEAVGPCGATFPNGNQELFEQALADTLDEQTLNGYLSHASDHLKRFTRHAIAATYLNEMEAALRT